MLVLIERALVVLFARSVLQIETAVLATALLACDLLWGGGRLVVSSGVSLGVVWRVSWGKASLVMITLRWSVLQLYMT